jgi:hypothetical protein
MLLRLHGASAAGATAAGLRSTAPAVAIAGRVVAPARLASFVTQLFDGRIDHADLFPYPTSDRTAAEPGSAAVRQLLHPGGVEIGAEIDPRALLAAQMPAYAPLAAEGDDAAKAAAASAAAAKTKDSRPTFGFDCATVPQDTVALLTQATLARSNDPNATAVTLATHLGVGSYLLRTLAGQFAPEVQEVAGGAAYAIVAADEPVAGPFVAAATTKTAYDDERLVYSLSGQKYVAVWPGAAGADAANSGRLPRKQLLLVLARAETQVTNEKGETEVAQRLAWFPVDLAHPDVKGTVQIELDSASSAAAGGGTSSAVVARPRGATITFKGTPVPGGSVLGAIGDGFRHHGIATLSTHQVLAGAVLGVVSRVLIELRALSASAQVALADGAAPSAATPGASASASATGYKLVPASTVGLIRARHYALESATYAFATNLDRQLSDTIIESACVALAVHRLARDVRALLLDVIPGVAAIEATAASANSASPAAAAAAGGKPATAAILRSCSDALIALTTGLGHSDHMALLAGSCGVEDYGLKMNKRPTIEMTTLRTARALGSIDRFPSLVACQAPAKVLERQIVQFAKAVHVAFVSNGPAVVQRESLLADAGEAAMLMFTASSALARANRSHASNQPTAAEEVRIATLFMTHASAEVDGLLARLGAEAQAPTRVAQRLSRYCVDLYSTAPVAPPPEPKAQKH